MSLEGKLAVANVVLNRVKSPSFPNTVYDVIFQKANFLRHTRAALKSWCPGRVYYCGKNGFGGCQQHWELSVFQ